MYFLGFTLQKASENGIICWKIVWIGGFAVKPNHSVERQQLVINLMNTVRKATIAHGKYLGTQREYLHGERLYMREAHFIIEIGLENQPTISELAERMNVTSGAISQLATRMEKKGFVYRVAAAEDKRKSILMLTEKGCTLYAEHNAYDQEKYSKIAKRLADYSDDQLLLFMDFEQKILEMFS